MIQKQKSKEKKSFRVNEKNAKERIEEQAW